VQVNKTKNSLDVLADTVRKT